MQSSWVEKYTLERKSNNIAIQLVDQLIINTLEYLYLSVHRVIAGFKKPRPKNSLHLARSYYLKLAFTGRLYIVQQGGFVVFKYLILDNS